MVRRIREILNTHPAGVGLHLMLTTVPVDVPEGSVLVQVARDGVVHLEPRPLADLRLDDTVHAPVDPRDEQPHRATLAYSRCGVRPPESGDTAHYYVS
ncbi:hypothetical protein [Streptomyces sp. 8L]|uniref:hypothetical protein n=1 Tax=Streptomyces sp. 8L TaxID=2877242 RepID=UPI001CD54FA1|nr:hypothetical protein [Streptomyces sp. 8L]MCA1220040.1 hypothetical protein [Streptomyces sp. 8L]